MERGREQRKKGGEKNMCQKKEILSCNCLFHLMTPHPNPNIRLTFDIYLIFSLGSGVTNIVVYRSQAGNINK